MITKSKVIKKSTNKAVKATDNIKPKITSLTKSNMKISARIDSAMHSKVKKFIVKNNLSINSLIRMAIEEYLSKA